MIGQENSVTISQSESWKVAGYQESGMVLHEWWVGVHITMCLKLLGVWEFKVKSTYRKLRESGEC